MKRFLALDGFRGLCALLVVVYHIHVLNSFAKHDFFRNSYLFVEFFFVLSGFVLYHTYGQGGFEFKRFKRFFISRTFRLFPLHLVMLLFFILLEIVKWFAEKKGIMFNNSAFTGAYAPSEILPNLFLLQSWLPGADSLSYNSVSWSISVEYYMYLIFDFIMLLLPGMKKYLFGTISILAFVSLFFHSDLLKLEPLRGLSCFFAGCLCYLVYSKVSKLVIPKIVFDVLELISVAAIIIVMLTNFENKGICISLLFCFTVIIFAFDNGIVSRLLKSNPVSFLGKLSYSIYIIHLAILLLILSAAMIASKVFGRDFSPMVTENNIAGRVITTGSVIGDNLLVFVILGGIIVISNFTYKVFELKGIALGKKVLERMESNLVLPVLPELPELPKLKPESPEV